MSNGGRAPKGYRVKLVRNFNKVSKSRIIWGHSQGWRTGDMFVLKYFKCNLTKNPNPVKRKTLESGKWQSGQALAPRGKG